MLQRLRESKTWLNPCVDDFYADFLTNLRDRGRSENTILSHKSLYLRFVKPVVGKVQLSDLTLTMGDRIVAYGESIAKTNGTRAVITFRQMLRFIVRSGHQIPFDWREVEVPPYYSNKKVVYLPKNDIEFFRSFFSRSHAKDSKHTSEDAKSKHEFCMVRMRAIFELNLHSGLRISELPQLNIDSLDWNRKQIEIVSPKTKQREQVFFHGAEKAIKDYLAIRTDESPALFVTHDGKRMTKNGLKTSFRLVKEHLDEDMRYKISSHVLRKTFGTAVARTIGSIDQLKILQKLMRHRRFMTTYNHYIGIQDEDLETQHLRAVSGL